MRPHPARAGRSPASPRCTGVVCRAQHRYPTQRGIPAADVASEGLADQADQVDEAVGGSPLVVGPTDNLDLIADHLGEWRVEDARTRIVHDVGGHDWVGAVLQVSLQGTVSRPLHEASDLLLRALT